MSSVEKGESLRGDQVLWIDLERGELREHVGYEGGIVQHENRISADAQHAADDVTYFLRGTFYDAPSPEAVRRWLLRFDDEERASWVRELDAEFTLVVWNRASGRVRCVTDLVGAHRLYVHQGEDGVIVTDRLRDQVSLQADPGLDDFGVYTFLTLRFPLDPHTLLEDTIVTEPGRCMSVSREERDTDRFYEPVRAEVENYSSAKECVEAIDATLQQYFQRRVTGDRVPLVMLSGGIDSVVMLRYLAEVAPDRTEALTFAVEGQENAELEEARIAAQYYDVPHHELIIPRDDIPALVRQQLLESDNAGFSAAAIRNWLQNRERPFDVFRGEDARLHTPPVDWAAKAGLFAHVNRLQNSDVGRLLWRTKDALRLWPFRAGKNYLANQAEKMDLRPDLQQYLLDTFVRYDGSDVPPGPLQERLYQATQHIAEGNQIEQIFRKVVGLSCRVQHTENRHWARYAAETTHTRLHMPFFHPEVTEVFNRIPFSVATQPQLKSPRKTRSPIPIVYKYVLRKLLEGSAPDELLYRHKAAPSLGGLVHATVWEDLYEPVLREWGEELLEAVEGIQENRELISTRRDEILAAGQEGADEWARPARDLVYLSTIVHWCRDSETALPEASGSHTENRTAKNQAAVS